MVSPYLRQQRPAREVLEAQIAAREAELAQLADPAARRPVEAALERLRRELTRLAQ